MLEDLGKDLANIAMAGVGAIAILTEKAVEVGKVCAKKGAETLEKGKAASEELRRKGEQVAAERREKARQDYLESLDAAGREELRRKLAELDAKEAAEKAAAEAAAAEAAAAEAAERTVEDNVIDFGGEHKDDGQGE